MLSLVGLSVLILAAITMITWWRLLQGKEAARRAAAIICRHHGLVLMDDTVMLESVQVGKRDPVRAWGLRYRFDYAHDGILHHGGSVLLSPGRQPTVVIQTDAGKLIEHIQ